jgi:HD-like signal output (HDOD) protein
MAPNSGILQSLLQRIESNRDFPALSGIITEINEIASSEEGSTAQLARAVLQDAAITYKLIKLVNSAPYRHFGKKIDTIYRAVVILGFERVRSIATTLMLLEFLQNKPQAAYIKEEIITAIFAGIVSTELSPDKQEENLEETIMCSMFFHLGKMLVYFYFFEESQKIAGLVASSNMTDEQAEISVLGLTCCELGAAVSRAWNFPPRVTQGMRKITDAEIRKPRTSEDYLHLAVNLSNEFCRIIARVPYDQKDNALQRLCERYRGAIKASPSILLNALEKGLQDMVDRSEILDLHISESPLIRNAMGWLVDDIQGTPA